MEQRSNDAALKDVRINLGMEDCAGAMEQNGRSNYAAAKGVRTKPRMEECV